MAKKLEFPLMPEWDYPPCDSADSRERREDMAEWEVACARIREQASEQTAVGTKFAFQKANNPSSLKIVECNVQMRLPIFGKTSPNGYD